ALGNATTAGGGATTGGGRTTPTPTATPAIAGKGTNNIKMNTDATNNSSFFILSPIVKISKLQSGFSQLQKHC
ncbi:MAG: hypothetical protein WCB05_20010, partial [Candidatus Sulfotelmatobacter sp.]